MGYAQQDPVSFCPHQKAHVQQLRISPSLPRQTAPSPGSAEVLSDGEGGLASPAYPSHDNTRLRHRLPDRLVGQHAGSIEVEFITDNDILAQHCYVLHAHLGWGSKSCQWSTQVPCSCPHPAQLTDLPTDPHGSASPRCTTQARSGSGCAHPEAPCTAGHTRRPPPPHRDPDSHWGQCCSSDQYGRLGPESGEESQSGSFVSQI